MRRFTILVTLAVVLGSMLATCGSEPVSLDQVPVYPQATPMERGTNEVADELMKTIIESSKSQGLRVDLNLYVLPQGTAWEDVNAFYEGELTGKGWEPAPDLSSESEHFRSAGWSRGSGSTEQALTLSYVDDVKGGTTFFVVALFAK